MRNEGKKINSAINVTPMVDVMLVLLIIFMVITPMLQPGSVPVDLAKTNHPVDMSRADKTGALIVSVMRDGKIFFGSESVSGETLTQKLKERLANRNDKTIYLRADARARYKFVVAAVDDARSAGVDQLGLLTEKRQRL
jgi:biopolymer transport protein ExbD/biopolymer transport protein TolR